MGFWKGFVELMKLPEIEEESDIYEGDVIRENEDAKTIIQKVDAEESKNNATQQNENSENSIEHNNNDDLLQKIIILIIGIIIGLIIGLNLGCIMVTAIYL